MANSLNPFQQWMVRSNMESIVAGDTTPWTAIQALLDGGYTRVANAVQAACLAAGLIEEGR